LYQPAYDGEKTVRGNNCVPVFEVPDLNREYERVKTLSSRVTEITDHGDLRLFQFEDLDGNMLEFYEMK
jgi:predicted enzyme related to lactoylglutathione lyase